jgi:copper chaperone CopZ
MTCQGCVRSVTNALQHTPGVRQARVSLEQQQASVIFDSTKTDLAALKAAVSAAGFDVP